MFDSAEEFHRRADECRKQAAKNAYQEEWLRIAETWQRMAEEFAGLSKEADSACSSPLAATPQFSDPRTRAVR